MSVSGQVIWTEDIKKPMQGSLKLMPFGSFWWLIFMMIF